MTIMEVMTHGKMGVLSSISGARQSGEKQEIKGTVDDIKMMKAKNHIKTIVIITRDQWKRKKFKMIKMQQCMQNGERILWCNMHL